MLACTAYELTLIIKLIVLERSNTETAKIVIAAYMCILAFTWLANSKNRHTVCSCRPICAFWHSLGLQTSPHIQHYMRFTRLLVTSSLFFIKIFTCVIRWNEREKSNHIQKKQ